MRKVLSYILILAVAIGSFLSPISASVNNNWNLVVQKNEVSAGEYDISFKLNIVSVNDNSAQISIDIKPGTTYGNAKGSEFFGLEWSEKSKNFSDEPKIESFLDMQKAATNWNLWDTGGTNNSTYSDLKNNLNGKTIQFNIVKNLDPEKEYLVRIKGFQFDSNDKFEKSRELVRKDFKTAVLGQGPEISGETGLKENEDFLPDCGVTFGLGKGSVYGCIIQVFYYAFWLPTSWLAGLAGKLLDFFVFYSINSASYNASGFVNEGWKVVRDIANIAFIFVLLYVALRTILGLGGSQAKKMISDVIVIALLINFSLFFTKVIVDSGNILANVLYNDIGSRAQKNGQVIGTKNGEFGEKGISAALVDQFDPQKIIQNANVKENIEDIKTPILVIIILATIVNIFMITTFLSIMFLFVFRVVGLMFSMIFSPFAFMSLTLPGSAGKIMKQWSWDAWLSELLNATFMAPIFIFFLWLILLFLNVNDGILFAGIQKSIGFGQGGGQILTNFIAIIAPFVLIIGLLTKAKEVTASMASEVATKLTGVAKSAVGAVGGLALGGVAFAGRAVVGRLASSVASGGASGAGTATVTRPPIVPSLSGLQGINKITARARSASADIAEQERAQREGIPTIGQSGKPARTTPTITYGAKDFLKEERERVESERLGIPTTANPISSVTPGVSKFLNEERERAQSAKEGIATSSTTPVLKTTPTSAISTPKAETSTTSGTASENKPSQTSETSGDTAAKQAVEAARKTSEEKARQAMSLKDMAATAPKSIFDLIKSKQKGEDAKNMLGKHAFNLAKYLGSASFDFRNNEKIMKFLKKETDLDFGKAGGKDGFEGMQKKIIENEEKYAKSLAATGKELEHINKLKLDQSRIQGDIDGAESKMEENKKREKAGRTDLISLTARDNEVLAFKEKVSAADKAVKKKNAERQATYAERVEKGGAFGYTPTQQEAALKIRALSKDKPAKDKIWEELKKEFDKDNNSTPAPASPAPAPTPTSPAGGGGPKK